MPRRLLYRRFYERLEERRRRAGIGAVSVWDIPIPPEFIDYWPDTPATLPEKLVLSELSQRGVTVYFGYYFGDVPFTPKREKYRPDFWLPEFKMVIEIIGLYWHSRPGAFFEDAMRAISLTAAGYRVMFLTDVDIVSDVREAVDQIPELAMIPRGRERGTVVVEDRPFDPNAAIRARMRKYPKVFRVRYITPKSRAVKVRTKWAVAEAYPRKPDPEFGPVFTGMSGEAQEMADRLARDWQDWMNAEEDVW